MQWLSVQKYGFILALNEHLTTKLLKFHTDQSFLFSINPLPEINYNIYSFQLCKTHLCVSLPFIVPFLTLASILAHNTWQSCLQVGSAHPFYHICPPSRYSIRCKTKKNWNKKTKLSRCPPLMAIGAWSSIHASAPLLPSAIATHAFRSYLLSDCYSMQLWRFVSCA